MKNWNWLWLPLVLLWLLVGCDPGLFAAPVPPSCTNHIVKSIESAHYRDVTVRLDNNALVVVNQPVPALKVGSRLSVCGYQARATEKN